jgi:iron complex outermembrane receptor protein
MSIALPQALRPRALGLRPKALATRALFMAASLAALCPLPRAASAQSASQQLPTVAVEAQKKRAAAKATPKAVPAPKAIPAPAPDQPAADPAATPPGGSLTTPTTSQAQAILAKVPGSVVVVPDSAYRNSTPADTLKDVLDYVPGVFVQPKFGDDGRLSIRGSGLSRNFHLRSLQLYMDGIPINTADGYGDQLEIDPSAYRYVEVYKGANALRYGANSLGGAINFVTPTGRDASLFGASYDIGSFGYQRLQASSGGVNGPFDLFVTGSWEERDGFRDHSWGESTRASANLGVQLSPDVETRLYFNTNDIMQRIPGTVTKDVALSSPTAAAAANVLQDQQRNIESTRIADKTVIRISPNTSLELGGFLVDRHLMHPIFQWLDYQYNDYGGFARVTDERLIGGFKNSLVAGTTLFNGTIDNRQFQNLPGAVKGNLLSSSLDKSENLSAYMENSFYFLPSVALVTGTQFLHATRERDDRFLSDGDQSGRTEFDLWSPKIGLLWNISPVWQVFANVSKSGEVPSFSENSFTSIVTSNVKAQTATTYEVGTRGRMPDLTWDLAAYRAEIENELQCLDAGGGTGACNVSNIDRTVHQGIEIGFGAAILRALEVRGPKPDKLWLNVAYTFNDFYFDGAQFTGNQLPGAPRHYLRGELLYKHPSGVYFGPNVEWVPVAYYVDNDNTTRTVPYALLGLKLGFDDGGPISAYVEGRNLTDERYIASVSITDLAAAGSALYEPGTGRSVFAGLRYRW